MALQILNKTNAHNFSPLPLQLGKNTAYEIKHCTQALIHSKGVQRAHTASLGGTGIPMKCPEQLIMYTQK